jgi:hypothetical protein
MKQKSNQTDEAKIASLKIETLPLASLKPHPRNPRKHPAKDSPEWKVLEASLKHDYFDPIVWNVRNGQLVSGHLRTKVLKNMGFESADVVVVDYDEPTHIARLMAANKAIGENDLPKMQELFGELKTVDGFDMAVAGFTLPEVDSLFEEADNEDAQPTDPDNPNGWDHFLLRLPPEMVPVFNNLHRQAMEGTGGTDYEFTDGTYAKCGKFLTIACLSLTDNHTALPALVEELKQRSGKDHVRMLLCVDPSTVYAFSLDEGHREHPDMALLMIQPSVAVSAFCCLLFERLQSRTEKWLPTLHDINPV